MKNLSTVLLLYLSIFLGCHSNGGLITQIKKDVLQKSQKGDLMVDSSLKTDVQNEFNNYLSKAIEALRQKEIRSVSFLLSKAKNIMEEELSDESLDLFYRTSTTNLLLQKEYKSIYLEIKEAKRTLGKDFLYFYNCLYARILYFESKKEQAWDKYQKVLKDDFLFLSEDDCLIITALISEKERGVDVKEWVDLCRVNFGYQPRVQKLLMQYYFKEQQLDQAILCWAESSQYLLSKAIISKQNIIDDSQKVPSYFEDSELFSSLVSYLTENYYIDDELYNIINVDDSCCFSSLLKLQYEVENNLIDGNSVDSLVSIEKMMDSFPLFHLITAQLMFSLDPNNSSNMIISLFDKALFSSQDYYIRNQAREGLCSLLNVDNRYAPYFISTQHMNKIVENINSGASASTITPLVELASLDCGYFSNYALNQLKKISSIEYVRDYLSSLELISSKNRGGLL